MSRTAERAGMDHPTRLYLVEKDADDHEERLDAFDARLGKILWALVGVLISTATSAILLALNLAVAR